VPKRPPRSQAKPPAPPSRPAKRQGLPGALRQRARRQANRPDPAKAKERLEQVLQADPRLVGAENLSALAAEDLAASSSPAQPGQPLRIPQAYLDALLNL
jgi:Tfp pilus assembly protein PilF